MARNRIVGRKAIRKMLDRQFVLLLHISKSRYDHIYVAVADDFSMFKHQRSANRLVPRQ